MGIARRYQLLKQDNSVIPATSTLDEVLTASSLSGSVHGDYLQYDGAAWIVTPDYDTHNILPTADLTYDIGENTTPLRYDSVWARGIRSQDSTGSADPTLTLQDGTNIIGLISNTGVGTSRITGTGVSTIIGGGFSSFPGFEGAGEVRDISVDGNGVFLAPSVACAFGQFGGTYSSEIKISSQGSGSVVGGAVSSSSFGAGAGHALIEANAPSSFVFGNVSTTNAGGAATLRSNTTSVGVVVLGVSQGGTSGTSLVEATSTGTFVHGFATSGGTVRASGSGAFVHGKAEGTGVLEASGVAAIALGIAFTGGTIDASGIGSGCLGQASNALGDMIASGNGAWQIGPGTNDIAQTLNVGNMSQNGCSLSGAWGRVWAVRDLSTNLSAVTVHTSPGTDENAGSLGAFFFDSTVTTAAINFKSARGSIAALSSTTDVTATLTGSGAITAANVTNASGTVTNTGGGSLVAVAIDSAASASVAGAGSAAFGQTSAGTGGTKDIVADLDNSWQFGPGTTLAENELHVGGGPTGYAGADTAFPGVRINMEGDVYLPDKGELRLGTGNPAQPIGTDSWDAAIQWDSDTQSLVLNPTSGSQRSTSNKWVDVGNTTSPANRGLRAGHLFVNGQATGSPESYLQMDEEAKITFGTDGPASGLAGQFTNRFEASTDTLNWYASDQVGVGADVLLATLGTHNVGDLSLKVGSFVAQAGGTVKIWDSGDADSVVMSHDGTDFNFVATDGTTVQYTFDKDVNIVGALNHDTGNVGFYSATPVAQASALTAALTQITHTAPGTPNYALPNMVAEGGAGNFGFATADDGNTVLSIILNLQTRVDELEAALDSATGVGLIT